MAKTEIKAPEAKEIKAPEAVKIVEIFVPRGNANDEPNMLISVNCMNFLLPRGKSSKVPDYVADEFYRSQRAQAIMDEHIDSMLGTSN